MNNNGNNIRFDKAFTACPLIAILRGIEPDAVVPVGNALVKAGFTIIEVPLNSPRPFESIARLVETCGSHAVIGAGTVTHRDEVSELARIGASLAISPHADTAIIRAGVDAGLVSLPGILSATEAFAAIHAGAHALKLFPMEMIGTVGLKALRAVLPKSLRLIAVGGVSEQNIPDLAAAGANGFGIGSTLYRPGDSAEHVALRARALVGALPDR